VKQELGIGRLLVAVYAVFSVSASARALFQISTKYWEAPLAYSLSAVSALVYLVVTFTLTKPRLHKFSTAALLFELFGVLTVGLLSFLMPDAFAHPSVWSGFGVGYGFIPLALPLVGIWWLRGRHA
jgi:hypothetical protein